MLSLPLRVITLAPMSSRLLRIRGCRERAYLTMASLDVCSVVLNAIFSIR